MREIHQPEGAFCYTFGPHDQPVASVQPGKTLVVYTVDALGDLLVDESQEPTDILGPYLNPQAGPLHIDGAEPAGSLAVTILDIEPVRVPGALFFTGDCHANQGEGELCGVALEIAAKGTLRFDLIKGKTIEWPRIENDEKIMVVGSAKPMEDAARIAYAQLAGWLVEDYGFETLDAYQLLTQAGELYVGNMVDPNYSLVAGVKKSFLSW